MINCIYCNLELPEHAKFCPKCQLQIVCIHCSSILYKDSSICISCGKDLKKINHSPDSNINRVEYTERNGEYSRNFNASFSNEATGHAIETLAHFFVSPKTPNAIVLPIVEKEGNDALYLAENNNTSIEQTENVIKSQIEDEYIEKLKRIFEVKNGEIRLFEMSIKANSKRDAVGRLVSLFLLYRRLVDNQHDVDRAEIKAILTKVSIDDDSFRAWLSSNRNYLANDNNVFSLTSGSLKEAKRYVLEVFDDSISNDWDLKNAKPNSSSKDTNSVAKKGKKVKNSTETQPITDLDLKPANKETLKDFFGKFRKVTNNYERNLAFLYYMQYILEIDPISANHVHTCYLDLKIKVPNIYQSLVETKGIKKWIDYDDMNNIKVNRIGKNYIEHDMEKL